MLLKRLRFPFALLVVCGVVVLQSGELTHDSRGFTRVHLENASDSTLTFLAIGTSEGALATAENRLSGPLPPRAVYSAVVSRPGNYWIRTEVETEGYTLERIEGPIRLHRGVCQWRFSELDARPLYTTGASLPTTSAQSIAAA